MGEEGAVCKEHEICANEVYKKEVLDVRKRMLVEILVFTLIKLAASLPALPR